MGQSETSESMRMRVIAAAVIITFLAGPAFAQAQKPMQQYGQEDPEKTQTEKNADREAERAYKRSLGNIPAQKEADPWGNVRSDNSQKPEAKAPAAKKAKTGTSSN
jgi:hypothetical protein